MDEFKKILKLTHSLKNQLLVVEKTLSVYSEKLPKHRLTQIGQTATNDAFELINQIGSIVATRLPTTDCINDNLSPWINTLLEYQKSWEENLNIKILVPKNVKGPALSPDINVDDFVAICEKYLGFCAISGASAVEISFKVGEKLVISMHDNGDGKMNQQYERLDQLIKEFKELGVNARIKCVNSLGCGLICELELS